MSTPLLCLVLYALWAVLLVTLIGSWRALQVLTGKKPANGFPSGTQHGSDAYWRLNRAHMNSIENLPIFASVVLVAELSTTNTLAIMSTLAVITLAARMAQSTIHIASGSAMAVNLRFTAFCVQLGCIALMAYQALTHVQSLR